MYQSNFWKFLTFTMRSNQSLNKMSATDSQFNSQCIDILKVTRVMPEKHIINFLA